MATSYNISLKRSYSESNIILDKNDSYFGIAIDSGYKSYETIKLGDKQNNIKYTEDAHCFFQYKHFDVLIIADGHGGTYEVARYVVSLALIYFRDYIDKNIDDIENALKELIKFIDSLTYDCIAGTTFNVAVIDKKTKLLTIANLGDSHLLVLRKNLFNKYDIVLETEDNDAMNPKEQRRILKITQYACFTRDGPSMRLNKGLMVCRGFGDKDSNIPTGVIGREQDIYKIKLMKDDLIIQSSDGLYESYYQEYKLISSNVPKRMIQIIDFINSYIMNNELKENIKLLPKLLLDDQINNITKEFNDINGNSIRYGRDNQIVHTYLFS